MGRALNHLCGIGGPHANHHRQKLLPSIRDLARDAGVAYNTMWKAVALCREHGLLVTKPGSPTRIVGDLTTVVPKVRSSPPRSGARPRAQAERTAESLYGDILTGIHPPGRALPPTKQLAAAYGACTRTVRAALRRLASSGIVEKHSRRFHVPLVGGGHHARVCLLGLAAEDGALRALTPRTPSHLYCLEQECSRRGIRLEVCPVLFRHGAVEAARGRIPSASDGDPAPLLGYMAWALGLRDSAFDDLARALLRSGTPVAVLLEGGHHSLSGDTSGRAPAMFSIADSDADGRRVGHFLLRLGHRKVAFVTPSWTPAYRRRADGLRDACRAAGLHDAVVECGPRTEPADELMDIESRSVQARIDALLAEETSRASGADPALHRTLQALRWETSLSVRAQIYRHETRPYADEVLSHPDVTAVVGANDWVGLECIDVLTSKGVRVPRDMSVIGFDDTQDAFLHGLSSYNFNGDGAIRAMLHHLLHPSDMRSHGQPTIEGFVTVRSTTGRAAARLCRAAT